MIPSTMKCIVYGHDRPTSRVVPTPPIARKGHVLVKVQAVGLNPVDAKDVLGDKLPHSWETLRSWLRYGIRNNVPGFDFAGTCAEENSPFFGWNDKVYGTMPPFQGSLAEFISVPIDQICYMPSNFSFEQAAALPLSGLTALQAMSPHVSAKSSVLVVGGSGGTGHVVLQVAKCLGAEKIATICSTLNVDFCRACGATEVIDYVKNNNNDGIGEALQTSSGKLFDFVMDCVSSADPRDQSTNYPSLLQATDRGALLTEDYTYRRLGGPTLDWVRAGLERTVGLNLWPNKHDKLFWVRFPDTAKELRRLQEWAESGKLLPHIAATYGFSEAGVKDAFDAILSRRVQGKVVVKVQSDESKE